MNAPALTVLSLFAGIGGLDLGLERAGMRVVGQVEKDPFCQQVLARHWPEVPRHDDVHTCLDWWQSRPRPAVAVVIGENVPGLRTRGLAFVHADLRTAGYRVRTGYLSACEMGAPHPRRRLFILAHTQSQGRCPWRPVRTGPAAPPGQQTHQRGPGRCGRWPTEPDLGRVAYGVPHGMDRRRALGNAVVPAAAEHIGHLITGHGHDHHDH
ncbi:MAG: DNA cytosine methyltransferase [Labedaea sp.]